MSYTPSSRQIGGIEVAKSEDSTSYRVKHFVLEKDLSSYIPAIGDAASWTPESCQVSSFSKTWYGPGCWIVSVVAKPYDSSFVSMKKDLGDCVQRSYSTQDLRIPPEWLGAWLAGSSDCPQFDSDGKLGPGEKRYLNASGSWSSPGDLVFFNAVPYEVDAAGDEKNEKEDATKGSANYAASPFQADGANIPVALAGQTVKTRVYKCSFYTKRLPQNISDFVGVNGEFSGDCRPADASAGRWKAVSQTVESAIDRNGKEWTRVARSMLQAPSGLLWDPDKNGGTWKW